MTAEKPARQQRTRAERSLLWTASVLGGVLVLALLAGAVTVLWPQASKPGGAIVDVTIGSGRSTASISRLLAAKGVISNAALFQVRARVFGADGKLKPGSYQLRTGMSDMEVIDLLEAGSTMDYVDVTIPEGFVITQIAARLQRDADIPSDQFIRVAKHGAPEFAITHPYLKGAYSDSLEGFLFPQTYRVQRGEDATHVVEMMFDEFDRQIDNVDLTDATRRGLTLPQVVTVASMIERESKLAKDRPLVSSVIANRLAQKMNLEIDATIQYVLPVNKLRLSGADIRLDTPYNTYTHPGLPPGPICNPGLAALQAAAHPAQTAYLYYVLTGKDGSHTFTTNKADFLKAKAKSIAVFGR